MTQLPRRLLLLITVAAAAALSACASTPNSGALYLLDQADQAPPSEAAQQHGGKAQTSLSLTPIQLAPYLSHQGIVYQTQPNQIVVADSNLWAAPLRHQLAEGLADTLQDNLADTIVDRSGAAPPGTRSFTLRVRVGKFQGRYDGIALIGGDWRLLDKDGHVVASHAFEQKIPLKKSGYTALVRALSRGWENVKQAMAKRIGAQLADK